MTSAAAAASAIQRIKDHHHEERWSAAFSRSEEIMRFQLVSASLGYFNSLNKLKAERETINDADTSTAAAVASNAAAAALVRAPAASIPSSIKPGKALESGVGVVGQKAKVTFGVKMGVGGSRWPTPFSRDSPYLRGAPIESRCQY